jgi:hypothetical protein
MAGLPLVADAQSSNAGTADIIYLESNSTSGNSVFAYRFNFVSSPTLISTTLAGASEYLILRSPSVRSIPIRI